MWNCVTTVVWVGGRSHFISQSGEWQSYWNKQDLPPVENVHLVTHKRVNDVVFKRVRSVDAVFLSTRLSHIFFNSRWWLELLCAGCVWLTSPSLFSQLCCSRQIYKLHLYHLISTWSLIGPASPWAVISQDTQKHLCGAFKYANKINVFINYVQKVKLASFFCIQGQKQKKHYAFHISALGY